MIIEIIDAVGVLNVFIVVAILVVAVVVGVSGLIYFVSRAWHSGKRKAEEE